MIRNVAALLGALMLIAMAPPPMSLEEFVTTANRIPMNPTSLLRSDARRLMREAETAFKSVLGEMRTAHAAGRQTAACPPDRIRVDSAQFLAHLNSIPAARRRTMTVADGVRHWAIAAYPCPG